jgi:lipid II:glycine glycyltransferase (peptidoglycan interpeptide bridge formation enzyme)
MFRYPKYFLQTSEWAKFWLASNSAGHNFYTISSSNHSINKQEQIFIYEYPWYFGQKFWYVPKLYLASHLDFENDFVQIINKIEELAFLHKPTFIKFDFDYQWLYQLQIKNNSQVQKFLKKSLEKTKKPYKTSLSNKSLQFLSTMTLDLEFIKNKKIEEISNDYSLESLQNFYDLSKEFWQKTSTKIRRYSKKSLGKNWQVETQKTPQNFEIFWEIYLQTSQRQKFAIHSKTYTKTLFDYEFSKIIILKDSSNKAQAVWFGLISEQTLTYLYGGNTTDSFKNYGQYLIHIIATKLAVDNHLKFYDLGGYNPNLGFGKFKEGYKGQIRNFLGPFDMILNSKKFSLTSFFIKLAKFGKS